MNSFRKIHANLGLRLLATAILIALLDVAATITLMPVFTCVFLYLRDGYTAWLLLVAQLPLIFAVYVLALFWSLLRDMWTGQGMFEEVPDA